MHMYTTLFNNCYCKIWYISKWLMFITWFVYHSQPCISWKLSC